MASLTQQLSMPSGDSLWTVRISDYVGSDFVPLVHDIVRLVCIQFSIQILYCMNGGNSSLFSSDFLLMLIYIVLGATLYWLVATKVVRFE